MMNKMNKLKDFNLVYQFNKKIVNYIQYKTYFQALQYNKLITLIKKYSKENQEVLDWGGGAGHLSAMLSLLKRKATLFSIVNKDDTWDILRKYFDIKFIYDPQGIRKICVDDKCFSTIISCGVLEHVRETGGDESDSLKDLAEHLEFDGHIIIYHLPLRYSYIEWISRNFRNCYSHPFRYNYSDINNIVKKITNLEVIDYGRYQILPRRIFGKIPLPPYVAIALDHLDSVICKTPLSYFAQCQYVVIKKTFK